MKATRYLHPRLPSRVLLDGWWLADPVRPHGRESAPPWSRANGRGSALVLQFVPRGGTDGSPNGCRP
jgi:hypothetical protein